MDKKLSIIYANRNRGADRIKISLDSLKANITSDVEVIMVDYGSEVSLVEELKLLCAEYHFVKFHHLPVPQVLWNKSKALNYGIIQAGGDFIFIADVDLIFHPHAISILQKYSHPDKFQLFKLSYLDKNESEKLRQTYRFDNLKPNRIGEVNGMVLASQQAFKQVNGFDEFFHFYGAEDVDLFNRLENAGFIKECKGELYFLHNWHLSFQGSEDQIVTQNSRLKNIMRINQEHFFRNRDLKLIKPNRQNGMGEIINENQSAKLNHPTKTYKIPNIAAKVEHFLNEELTGIKNEIIKVQFYVDPYYNTAKYKIKVKMGRQTQPYLSLKEINDLVLKKILFDYRDYNYSFKISDDFNCIFFHLEL